MSAHFKHIMKTTLFESLVRGGVRPGIVGPLVLCAPSKRQRKRQCSDCKCFMHNLPSKTNEHPKARKALLRLKHRFSPSVACGMDFSLWQAGYSCKGTIGRNRSMKQDRRRFMKSGVAAGV